MFSESAVFKGKGTVKPKISGPPVSQDYSLAESFGIERRQLSTILHQYESHIIAALGSSMAEIADVISLEAFVRLVEVYSGQDIYVARRLPNKISAVIGEDQARALGERFAGERFELMGWRKLEQAIYPFVAFQLKRSGVNNLEIARRIGWSENYMRRRLNYIRRAIAKDIAAGRLQEALGGHDRVMAQGDAR